MSVICCEVGIGMVVASFDFSTLQDYIILLAVNIKQKNGGISAATVYNLLRFESFFPFSRF